MRVPALRPLLTKAQKAGFRRAKALYLFGVMKITLRGICAFPVQRRRKWINEGIFGKIAASAVGSAPGGDAGL